MVLKPNQLIMYRAKVAACSENGTKHSTQSEHHVEFLNGKSGRVWWYVLGRPRRRWVDNIRMDLQQVGCGYMDWIGLAQDRNKWRTLVSAVMNFRVP